MSFRTRALAATSLVVLGVSLSLSACCTGPDYLTIGLSGSSPWWGERRVWSAALFTVDYALGKETGGEPLEFYRGDERIDVPRTEVARDNALENGCGHSTVITYDASELETGEYTVVHRRASGTGDPVNCGECPWTTFDGEEALVLMMDL